MITKSAKEVKELRVIIDELEKAANKGFSATSDRELAQAKADIRTVFQALEWNIRTVAIAVNDRLEGRLVDIRYGRIAKPTAHDTSETPAEKAEEPAKKRYTKKSKK